MALLLPQLSPRPRGRRTLRPAGADVVGIRPDPAALGPALCAASGFRVDGPDGRIGVLRGVAPAEPGAPPQRLLVSTGLFVVTTVLIPVSEVRWMDVDKGRIVVRITPEPPHRSPAELTRGVRRSRRTAARRAAKASQP